MSDRSDPYPDLYGEKLDAIYDRADHAIDTRAANSSSDFLRVLKNGNRNAVIYSAYEIDENDLPIDNLDEVPFKGTFIVKGLHMDYWDSDGDGETYHSNPITDPTWLQLTVLANDCVNTTRDYHHIFFEGVNKEGKYLTLAFGS